MEWENEKAFVCRTKYNLALYKEYKSKSTKGFDYEVTQLINSFLGLIVFVKEFDKEKSCTLEEFIVDTPPTRWNYIYKKEQEEHNFENYLRHIRNAIAHPKDKIIVNANNNNNDITSITFKDFNDSSDIFETTLTLEKIDELVVLLTDAFFGNDKCMPNGKIES